MKLLLQTDRQTQKERDIEKESERERKMGKANVVHQSKLYLN